MTREFRKSKPKCVLSPDQRAREGKVVRLAQASFPNIGAALAFLNGHDDALGARPLDLAIDSETGLLAVEAAIAARGAQSPAD